MPATVSAVEDGSPAFFAGIEAGDTIIKINDIQINDYLDYMYASCMEKVNIVLKEGEVEIINEDFEPLGIAFETLLIDEPKSCRNKCIFCFIDQLPGGMRETCYFKDDDFRLSFLQGNYVTMTNMTEDDVERIIKYNIPRINVSVHTTNPKLREKMLNNRFAGKITKYLKMLSNADVNINAQIVLCPGINDKKELDRTVADLAELPNMPESVSVVPVGLSDFRKGLFELSPFDEHSSFEVVKQIEMWQKKLKREKGRNFLYAADEFYINAKLPFPKFDDYCGFPQIENGVGLCASLIYEFENALKSKKSLVPKTKKTIATGICAYNVIRGLADRLKGDKISVVAVENSFFGSKITVTGLLTGRDIINALKGKDIGKLLLLSKSMFKHGEEILLDDTAKSDIENSLGVRVIAVENDGYELLDAMLG